MKLKNRTVLASTGKRPVEIERQIEHPFCPHGHGSMMMQASTGNARRAAPSQDAAWTGAMFDLQTGGVSRVPTRTWFPLGTTGHRASKGAGAAEGRVPGDIYESGQRPGEPDYGPWTRVETESGIGRTSDRVFQHS